MATGEAPKIPAPNDNDFLTRVRRAVKVASAFKKLVIDLSTQDWSGYINLDEADPPELDEQGRFMESLFLAHGDYRVLPGNDPEIDRVNFVEAGIKLANPAGGRSYLLHTDTEQGRLLTIHYDEVAPESAQAERRLDVLGQFTITAEMAHRPGIHPNELRIIDACTQGVVAVRAAERLVAVECPYY